MGLLLQGTHLLDFEDRLSARALAALALSRALQPDSAREEECLLARRLRYPQPAARAAEGLPPDSAVRAYVLEQSRALEQLARRPGATDETRHLHLLRISDENEAWRTQIQTRSEELAAEDFPHALSSAYAAMTFENGPVIPPLVLQLLTEHWLSEESPADADYSWSLSRAARVENAIARAAEKIPRGAFIDPELYADAADLLYFHSLIHALRDSLDRLGSLPAAQSVLLALPADGTGKTAAARRYWQRRVQLEAGRMTPAERRAGALDPALGIHPRSVFASSYGEDMNHVWDIPPARELGRAFHAGRDSRPCNLEELTPVLREQLSDHAGATLLERTRLRDRAPSEPQLRNRWRVREGRLDELWAEVDDAALEPLRRVQALRALMGTKDADPARLRERCRALWLEPALRPPVFRTCSWYLATELHDAQAVIDLARAFIADPSSAQGLDRSHALAKLADALIDQGQPEAAWSAIEPALRGQVGSIYGAGIRALLALERFDDAEALIRRAEHRYPESDQAELVELLWRRGRPREAAQLAGPRLNSGRGSDFGANLSRRFATVFKDRPLDEIGTADEELLQIATTLPAFRILAWLPHPLIEARRFDAAFELSWRRARWNEARIHNPALPLYGDPAATFQQDYALVGYLATAWKARRELDGPEAADRWLLSLMPNGFQDIHASQFYQLGLYTLLWSAYPEPASTAVWDLRALAAALAPAEQSAHGAALRTHCAQSLAPAPDQLPPLGAIALGLADASSLVSQPLRKPDLCRATFTLGIAAEAAGDLDSATQWYQTSLSTDATAAPEFAFAAARLSHFRNSDLAFKTYDPERPARGEVRAEANAAAGSTQPHDQAP